MIRIAMKIVSMIHHLVFIEQNLEGEAGKNKKHLLIIQENKAVERRINNKNSFQLKMKLVLNRQEE